MKKRLPITFDSIRLDTPDLEKLPDISTLYVVQTIVKNGSDVGSELVSRMEALYLLCRNSIIPSFFLILGLFSGAKRFVGKRDWLKFWLTLLTLEFLLVIASAIMFHSRIIAILNGLVLINMR